MKINWPVILATTGAAILANKFFGPGDKTWLAKIKILEGDIKFDKAKIKAASYQTIFYTIYLPVVNPTGSDVNSEAIFIESFLNGQLIGNANTTKVYTFKKNSTTIIPISFSKDLSELPQLVYDIIQDLLAQKEILILVKGKINFKPGVVKFSYTKGAQL